MQMRFLLQNRKKNGNGDICILSHNFWMNQGSNLLSTLKWLSEPQFCEIWSHSYQKMAGNGHKWHFIILFHFRTVFRYLSWSSYCWAHETTYAYIGNKHFFTKSCQCQTYQNSKISWQKMCSILLIKGFKNRSYQKMPIKTNVPLNWYSSMKKKI